jgi:hypothetical protein
MRIFFLAVFASLLASLNATISCKIASIYEVNFHCICNHRPFIADVSPDPICFCDDDADKLIPCICGSDFIDDVDCTSSGAHGLRGPDELAEIYSACVLQTGAKSGDNCNLREAFAKQIGAGVGIITGALGLWVCFIRYICLRPYRRGRIGVTAGAVGGNNDIAGIEMRAAGEDATVATEDDEGSDVEN